MSAIPKNYTGVLQDRVAEIFVNVVAEKYPHVAEALRKKIDILKSENPATTEERCGDKSTALMDELFHSLVRSDDQQTMLLVAEMDAKLVDVQWRVRKTAGISVVNAVAQSRLVRTGDTFAELIERFCRKNLPSSVVQNLLQYAYVWPSLTTHPTNPTSFAYTTAGLKLDKMLAEPATTVTRLVTALRDIRDTSMEFDVIEETKATTLRKTPHLEICELISILNVVYDSVVGPQQRLREALDRFGYGDVTCDTPLLNMNVWGAGDGDGNPTMDCKWLQHQVDLLRKAIRDRYVADLQHSAIDLCGEQHIAFTTHKEIVISKLLQSQYTDSMDLLGDLRSMQALLASGNASGTSVSSNTEPVLARALTHLGELIVKCRAFGLRFAGTDVRHNSVDIMEAAGFLLQATGLSDVKSFSGMTPDKQCEVMRSLFSDAEKRNSVAAMSPEEVQSKLGDVGARVFLRLRVIAKNPEMFQKLIIAETRSAANALAALLLLRFSGNKVAEPGARLSIVPLFESREDLSEAPQAFHILATDETFSSHIRHVGHFMAMIAKSDTTRLSGPGVQGRQEETVGRLMAANPLSYGSGFCTHIFIGGGDDQMRGGGRIVETPHVLMLAAKRMGASHPSRFAMTIQGLQMQLVFGSRLMSEHFIEAFAAQQMLAAARLQEFIRYRPVPDICNRKAADQSAHDFFKHAMDQYEAMVGSPSGTKLEKARRATIVNYFHAFPSAIVAAGNKSSRPMARKSSADPLQGRAISLDQLAKHDGAYVTATLGVADALAGLKNSVRTGTPEKAGEMFLSPLRHTYLANKSFRDFVRMQAVVLFQKDYSVAWRHRGGRPLPDELANLLSGYRDAVQSEIPADPRAFLAFVEQEDLKEAKLLLEAIKGQGDQGSPVTVRTPLTIGWPDLAEKMASRERQGALCQRFVSSAIAALPASKDEIFKRIGYFGYVGVNPKFSSPSFSLTMTDPQKEGQSKTSEASPAVACRIVIPRWATVASKL